MRSFNNKVAAITGAASGMGRQLAVQLTRHGCHLALSESVQNNKRRVLVGWDAIVLDKVQRLFPAAYAVIVGVILRRTYNR